MAKIIWKEDTLLNIQLKDDLFTIGQLLYRPFMRFFNIQDTDGNWVNINLNAVETLFCVMIGSKDVFPKLVKEKINEKSVIPSHAPFERLWIKPHLNFDGGFAFKGGKLIELGADLETTTAPVVIENLDIIKDREIIEKYELTNMFGAEELSERLIRFFETGNRIDSLKEKVFPGLFS